MVNFEVIVDKLSSKDQAAKLDPFIESQSDEIVAELANGTLRIVDFVKGLNPILTNGSHEVRANGVRFMVHSIVQLPHGLLNEKEIETLTEFMCLRLIDHKSMEQPALRCLSFFVDCDNKPVRYNKQLIEFIRDKSNPHRMDAKTRHRIYELLKKVIVEKRRSSNVIDGDLIYSLVSILEGENNPDNLLLCFGMISYILKNFIELDPFMDDIFEWLSSYYPVDYTPSEKEDGEAINIQRSDLVQALYDCFYATPSNSDNLQTLLLEKLDSNVMSSKLESLECLIKCYEQFPFTSIQKYNSTLWTAIRMNCLRKINTIDSKLLETSLRALTALAKRLSEDGDLYFTFISDLYEELAIAFRKPEMELFEPAARLLTHAILPSMKGFNYVLDKILTISMNALEVDELRPLVGLAYIFERLHMNHPDAKLKSDLDDPIKKLLIKVLDKIKPENVGALTVIEALISLKVPLGHDDLDEIITKLRELNMKVDLDIERCLALICLNYRRKDIISDEELVDYDLGSLIKLIHCFDLDELKLNKLETSNSSFPTSLSKLSVYMRLLIIQLDSNPGPQIDSINQQMLNLSLIRMREIASSLMQRTITERIALVHSIVLNKLAGQSVSKILMDIFSSDYCQKLVPVDDEDHAKTQDVYLPILKPVFKSLVIRNHQLAAPLINLFLNFMTSDKVSLRLALDGARVFSFVQSDDLYLFNVNHHYQVFSLYRQKFYSQSNKEIRVRFNKQSNETKKYLLLCSLALQIPHLPFAAYRRDYDWIVRQLLTVLLQHWNTTNSENDGTKTETTMQDLFSVLFNCLDNLIQRDSSEHLVGFLPSLIELCLRGAGEASSLQTRKQALVCLTKIAASFNDADLLVFRPKVIDKLRSCLADKKRLVRQTAAVARLRWIIIGQPIGSV